MVQFQYLIQFSNCTAASAGHINIQEVHVIEVHNVIMMTLVMTL